jgi:hypothetical protein
LPEVAAAVRVADSCQVAIRLAAAGFSGVTASEIVEVNRVNGSIAGRHRLVRAIHKPRLLTICYGLAGRGEMATVRQELAGFESDHLMISVLRLIVNYWPRIIRDKSSRLRRLGRCRGC